jgi:hypothetical protein
MKNWQARFKYLSGRYSKAIPVEINLKPKGRKAYVSDVFIKTKKPKQVIALEIIQNKTVFFTKYCNMYGTEFSATNITITID